MQMQRVRFPARKMAGRATGRDRLVVFLHNVFLHKRQQRYRGSK